MQTEEKNNKSILFTIITLVAFVFTLFLIIFLKQHKGKKGEQPLLLKEPKKSRVKISNETQTNLNNRQKQILEEIQTKKRMTPKQIYGLVPNVSTRTVRRDMDALVEKELVKQQGSTKATTYIYTGS